MDWHLTAAISITAGAAALSTFVYIRTLRKANVDMWVLNQLLTDHSKTQASKLTDAYDLLARFNAGILEYRTTLQALQVPEITRLKKDNPKRIACQLAFDFAAQNLADLIAESSEISEVSCSLAIMEAMKLGDLEEA